MRNRAAASPSKGLRMQDQSGTPATHRQLGHLERYGKTYMVLVAFMMCATLGFLNSWKPDTYHGETKRPPGPQYEVVAGAEVVWEVPPHGAHAVLFLAHGCSHSAVDFWHASRGCPKCIGLPEEMRITRQAVSKGYALVAVSSADRAGSRCWELPDVHAAAGGSGGGGGTDIKQVKAALTQLLRRERLHHLPLFALGASSGGAFVLALASELLLTGVVSQIMALPPHMLTAFVERRRVNGLGGMYPPVMFVHMPRDEHTASLVEQDMQLLTEQGVTVRSLPVPPAPLTPSYLSDVAFPEINREQSEAIYKALKAEGFLGDDGLLKDDPRDTDWRSALQKHQVPGLASMRLQPDLSAVSEELNVLYAQHEIVASTTGQTLEWFASLPAVSS